MTAHPNILELSGEELSVLVDHLHRHLDLVDRELVRTDNPTLQHHIAHEAKVLETIVKRMEGVLQH